MAQPAGLTIIGCGALARELLDLIKQFPDGQVKKQGRRILVAYGDCGTGGDIDRLLQKEQVDRIAGPHCYEMYMGKADFDAEMEAELGVRFL